jgi:hypothetical protein
MHRLWVGKQHKLWVRKMHRLWVGKRWSLHRLKGALKWQSICIGIYSVV